MNIRTERLVVRPPAIADFETFWRMNNDPEVKRYTGGVTALSREAALAQHEESCRTFDGLNPAECIFSVEERSTGRCIVYCGFEYSERLGGIELAYGLEKGAWGRGFASEAAEAVLRYGFETLRLDVIAAAVNPENAASERILMKLGLHRTGQIPWPGQGLVNRYEIRRSRP